MSASRGATSRETNENNRAPTIIEIRYTPMTIERCPLESPSP
jgi:hypothetical protein